MGTDPDLGIDLRFISKRTTIHKTRCDPMSTLADVNYIGANPIPIPTTLILIGSGLIGIAGLRRKIRTG